MSAQGMLYQGQPAGDWAQLRGLHYGDGVFRTMLCHDGAVVDLDRHYRKLVADAARIELDAPSLTDIGRDLDALRLADAGSCVIKLLLCRAPGARGYAPRTREAHRLVQLSPLPDYPAELWEQGVYVELSELRLGRQPRLAGVKHLNRLEQVLASQHWPEGCHEALMCDDRRLLVCGTRSNVFFIRERMLVTPELNHCGVAGVMRDRVLELAVTLGLVCEVRRARLTELEDAEECFLTNSLVGIWPVSRLGKRRVGTGPVTRELMRRLAHPWRGRA